MCRLGKIHYLFASRAAFCSALYTATAGALKGVEEAGDLVLAALLQSALQEEGHGVGRAGVDAGEDVVDVCEADEAVDVGLVGVGREGIHEEEDAPEILEAHEGAELGVATQGTGAEGRAELDVGVVAEGVLEHGDGGVGARESELAEDLLVGDDELLHGRLHVVVGDEGEAPHLIGLEEAVELEVVGIFGGGALGAGPILVEQAGIVPDARFDELLGLLAFDAQGTHEQALGGLILNAQKGHFGGAHATSSKDGGLRLLILAVLLFFFQIVQTEFAHGDGLLDGSGRSGGGTIALSEGEGAGVDRRAAAEDGAGGPGHDLRGEGDPRLRRISYALCRR